MTDISFTSERDRLSFRVGHYRRQAAKARRGEMWGPSSFWLTRARATIAEYREKGSLA